MVKLAIKKGRFDSLANLSRMELRPFKMKTTGNKFPRPASGWCFLKREYSAQKQASLELYMKFLAIRDAKLLVTIVLDMIFTHAYRV
jgi:hypothetical protein